MLGGGIAAGGQGRSWTGLLQLPTGAKKVGEVAGNGDGAVLGACRFPENAATSWAISQPCFPTAKQEGGKKAYLQP